jgi:GNAT superfamily N-acetyltransferase
MQIIYKNLEYKDIPILTPIMKAAFDEDTRMHTELLADGPPGYDTGKLLEKLLQTEDTVSKVILCDEQVIGEYTVSKKKDVLTLEMFFIDPKYSSQGIGFRIWKDIKQIYPEAIKWYVETPDYSIRNRHFYEKCGFKVIKEKVYENGAKSIIFVQNIIDEKV